MTWFEQWRGRVDRLRAGLGLAVGPGDARVVQVLGLGPGARLLVIDFAGRRLLLGQTRAGLASLAEVAHEP